MKRNRGFTLMEMLIVVAIIAVLAAIAIPVFNGSLHKAKVAADMANVRAYYAELQTQLILTGESDFTENRYLSEIVKLQAGMVAVRLERGPGQGYTGTPLSYQMYYVCDKGDHELRLE